MAQRSDEIVSRTDRFSKRFPMDGMVGDARKRYEASLEAPCTCEYCLNYERILGRQDSYRPCDICGAVFGLNTCADTAVLCNICYSERLSKELRDERAGLP